MIEKPEYKGRHLKEVVITDNDMAKLCVSDVVPAATPPNTHKYDIFVGEGIGVRKKLLDKMFNIPNDAVVVEQLERNKRGERFFLLEHPSFPKA